MDWFLKEYLKNRAYEKGGFVKILDRRKQAKERSNFSGYYDSRLIRKIVKHSLKYDVNPYYTVALALLETNLGKTGEGPKGNVFHLKVDEAINELNRVKFPGPQEDDIELGVAYFKHKYDTAAHNQTEAHRLQAWTGYGYPYNEKGKRYYGKKVIQPYFKDPLSGKRLIDMVKNTIGESPEVLQIIREETE